MESNLKRLFGDFKNTDKKLKALICLGLAGVLIIVISEYIPSDDKKSETVNVDYTYEEYVSSLEDKTEKLISEIDGAGRCSVMITLKNSNESVFAKNSEETSSDSSYSKNSEYVLYDGQGGDSPILIKQYFPEVQGVAIVCDGADNTVVRENIINSVSSLFSVPVSRITVSKISNSR